MSEEDADVLEVLIAQVGSQQLPPRLALGATCPTGRDRGSGVDQNARTAAPAPLQRRCTDRPVSRFRRVDEFRGHPPGGPRASANRRPQMSAGFHLELGANGNSLPNRAFVGGRQVKVAVSTAAGAHAPAGGPATGGRTARCYFPGDLNGVAPVGDTLTETTLRLP